MLLIMKSINVCEFLFTLKQQMSLQYAKKYSYETDDDSL